MLKLGPPMFKLVPTFHSGGSRNAALILLVVAASVPAARQQCLQAQVKRIRPLESKIGRNTPPVPSAPRPSGYSAQDQDLLAYPAMAQEQRHLYRVSSTNGTRLSQQHKFDTSVTKLTPGVKSSCRHLPKATDNVHAHTHASPLSLYHTWGR